jgi:hypothetical protein
MLMINHAKLIWPKFKLESLFLALQEISFGDDWPPPPMTFNPIPSQAL